MDELQVFNNPEFGEIRALVVEGEPWFVAADVCKVLEIQNSRDALTRLDDDEKSKALISNEGVVSTDTPGGVQEMNIVNEYGLYTLVLGSRKKEAKVFKRWLTHEVIPTIRRTGAYIAPQAQPPATLDAAALQTFAAAVDTLTATVQTLVQRMDAQGRGRGPLSLPARASGDNPFEDSPVDIKPPSNKMRRVWMRTASEKLNMLSEKCGLPSSSVLHKLYQEMEEECGVILSELRLKALEEHQLTDCSVLVAIFYDKPMRLWFERRVEAYLAQEVLSW